MKLLEGRCGSFDIILIRRHWQIGCCLMHAAILAGRLALTLMRPRIGDVPCSRPAAWFYNLPAVIGFTP